MNKVFSRKRFVLLYILLLLDFSILANYFYFRNALKWVLPLITVSVPLLIAVIMKHCIKLESKRLRFCFRGAVALAVFELSVFISAIYHLILAFEVRSSDFRGFLFSAIYCIIIEGLLFWCGIISVYLTSVQLGIKIRVLGIIFGMIPIANQIVLRIIVNTVFKEVIFEAEKEAVNKARKDDCVCRTKYPILFVHGVFFRDSALLNYWGRIPDELEKNGATVYYGQHQSADSIADCAAELAERIENIVRKTGCEKLNVIAHSKGGLDMRYALAHLGTAPYVASLTTVNTPHRGCIFADYLLDVIPERIQNKIADTYNSTLKKLGDPNPDFISAVKNLTATYCCEFDRETKLPEGVYAQSIGSVINKASGGRFPMNYTYRLVKRFDGPNDGLVRESAFSWGEKYTLLKPKGKRGISHCDITDLNRDNIPDFDVREFYVELVNDLKNKGM